MKTAVLASLSLASSSVALTKEETLSKVQTAQKQTHELAEHLKHPLEHNTELANAIKTLSGQPLSSTLKAKTVSRSRVMKRSLRGKGGKGKGKGKGDDDSSEDSEEDNVSHSYFQMQTGFCAGSTLGDVTLTEDFYVTSLQFTNNVCVNGVMMDGDMPFSYSNVISINEGGQLVRTIYSYMLHDCVDEYLMQTEMPSTDEFLFGGSVSPNGMCTDTGFGFGARVALSESPLMHSSGEAGVIVEAEDSSANDCYENAVNGNYVGFDLVEYTANEIPTSFGYTPICYEKDFGSGDDDYYYADDDLVPDGGSHSFDLSRCSEDPPVRVMNIYTSNDCSGNPTVESEPSDFCYFDREHDDFLYQFQTCWAGA